MRACVRVCVCVRACMRACLVESVLVANVALDEEDFAASDLPKNTRPTHIGLGTKLRPKVANAFQKLKLTTTELLPRGKFRLQTPTNQFRETASHRPNTLSCRHRRAPTPLAVGTDEPQDRLAPLVREPHTRGRKNKTVYAVLG